MRFEEIKDMFILGAKIKRKSWGGYWEYDSDRNDIIMHCKEGTEIMLKSESTDLEYTLSNICCDDWEIADEENTPVLGGNISLTFRDLVKYLREGKSVRRKNWYSKDYIYYTGGKLYKSESGIINEWTPNKEALLANDWEFYN